MGAVADFVEVSERLQKSKVEQPTYFVQLGKETLVSRR
jgi:hypothetical protein